MFVIKPESAADWAEALFILSYYRVACATYSDGENAESVYMTVHPDKDMNEDVETTVEQLHMAEMAFQMNWHQVGMVCPVCEDTVNICGDLTFNKPINGIIIPV